MRRFLTATTLLIALLGLAACGLPADRAPVGYGSGYDQGGGT